MRPNTNRPKKQTKGIANIKTETQRDRFINTARELEVDESGEMFESAFAKLMPRKGDNSA